jgi:hypothetical protein
LFAYARSYLLSFFMLSFDMSLFMLSSDFGFVDFLDVFFILALAFIGLWVFMESWPAGAVVRAEATDTLLELTPGENEDRRSRFHSDAAQNARRAPCV